MYKTQADEVRDWLRAYVRCEAEIDDLLEKLRTLRASVTSISAQEITDMPKAASAAKDTLAEYMVRVEELERRINEKIAAHQLGKKAIEGVLEKMESPKQRRIIKFRYLDGLEWSDVIYQCYHDKKDYTEKIKAYSKRVYRDHDRALLEMARRWMQK